MVPSTRPALFALALFSHFCTSTRVNYHGYKLFRFEQENNVFEFLRNEVEENGNRFDENGHRMPIIDFFTEPNRRDKFAQALVAPEFVEDFLNVLMEHDVKNVELLRSNIQSDIVSERNEEIKQRRRRRRNVFMSGGPSDLRSFDVFAYHRYDKIVRHLKALANYKPEMVTLLNITKSFEGRDLVGLKITSPHSTDTNKPSIFVDAGIHSREWIAIGVAIYLIDRLVNEYEFNPQIKWLVDEFDWYIVPAANPDGYEFSMTTDRLWRKTRSKDESVSKWCRGADANRNWSFRWGEAGATRSPCSNTYSGSRAFSEPEVVGLKNFLENNVRNLKVYASFHAYGQLMLTPWGYTSERPGNYRDQQVAAKLAVDAIKNTTGAVYEFGTIAQIMYPASGTSIDYLYAVKHVPFVYGIELRPREMDPQYGFVIPPSQIEPTGREMLSAFMKIGEFVKGKLPMRPLLRY